MQSPKIVAKGRPKGDTYYKDIASNYEKKRKKQAWWHVEQEQMAQLLDQLPDGMSVVDIPFGTGRFVPMYRKKGFKIAGLDASEDMILTAQNILGSDFDGIDARVGDAASLPFKDNEFDLLVSTRFLRDLNRPCPDASSYSSGGSMVVSRRSCRAIMSDPMKKLRRRCTVTFGATTNNFRSQRCVAGRPCKR